MKSNFKLRLLLGVFISLIVGMNFLGAKLVSFFGISVSVAIFMLPFSFLITDMVAEVYGKKYSKEFVIIGEVVLVLMFFFSFLFVQLEPHERFVFNQEYSLIFSSSLRIMAASAVAFFLSQLHDVWAFEFWKQKTGGKFLWLRNNLSTMVSQVIDTLVFMFLAFYQVTEKYDVGFIFELAIPFYLFKVLFAALDTPFVYLGVRWLRR